VLLLGCPKKWVEKSLGQRAEANKTKRFFWHKQSWFYWLLVSLKRYFLK